MPPITQKGRRKGLLFWVAAPLCGVTALLGILSPSGLERAATAFTRAAFSALDWFFMLSVSAFLVLTIWLALGRYGDLKLGRDDEEPEFSRTSWIAMLFSAGMGVGLLFWGAAEPLTHFTSPPTGEGGRPPPRDRPCSSPTFTGGCTPGRSMASAR